MADLPGQSGYTTPRHLQRSGRPSVSSPRPSSSSSPLARAQWPWTNTLQYVQRPSSAMSSQAGMSTVHNWEASPSSSLSGNQQPWSATPKSAVVQPSLHISPEYEDHGIRQWNFSAFEWTVPNVRELKKFVEGQSSISAPASIHSDDSHASNPSGAPSLLRETPVVDGKFKLEIGRAPQTEDVTTSTVTVTGINEEGISHAIPASPPPQGSSTVSTTLSLCLTSLQLDYDQTCEIATTIMVGIKANTDFVGQRGARAEWVWEFWDDFVFRKGSEFWECNLPALPTLLDNPRISASDSFTLSIQLHTPVGPHFPQQPAAYYVPKDLLDGLEASLDNSNTGDVQFVCLERFSPPSQMGMESATTPISPSTPTSSSGLPPPMARKRVIYAHSDILTRRSEYFSTLISSSFRESSSALDRERGRMMHTIVVEDADFVTVYWLLKYLYCDWLLFREDDDPRAAVDGIGAGWSARWLSQGNEWEWKTFSGKTGQFEDSVDEESTAKSVASDSISAGSIISDGSHNNKAANLAPPIPPVSTRMPSRTGASSSLRPSTSTQAATTRRPAKLPLTTTNISAAATHSSSPSRSSPPQQQHSHYYPLSPSQARVGSNRHQHDPHEHPTPAPPAASALSVYQLAHRYRIPGLQHLALEHMMSSLAVASAFSLLLATCFWPELNDMVQDYIVEHWSEVSGSPHFETCCLEVAAGEWGPEGGKTLASLFRRLHSPTVRFTHS
ncbi:hypothetical protein M408DRAFT_329095 [Serendipita vermifera MAFF 305830]|uniref:BTB domain-containing protein n=1 Tax=Serendipita vermifera MAFF 305830 TaxID=933852 RepID=A0A0C3AX32_SERVB|nr:hypothetical protein M408DRAFT_329095 [Serendipita vermifera MAFF 305830]